MQEAQSDGHDSLFQEFQLEPFDYTDILDAMPTSQQSTEPQLVRIFSLFCSHATHPPKKKKKKKNSRSSMPKTFILSQYSNNHMGI
jgi:hypothetical protein